MVRIIMVCLGNICRSPLAEGILQAKVDAKKVFVDSAGTAAYHVGNSPDKRSVEVARKYGINISNQYARKFMVTDFDVFDFIYVMDEDNLNNITSLARNKADLDKVHLILNVLNSSENLNVPDPYYGTDNDFEKVYKLLDSACNQIAYNIENVR